MRCYQGGLLALLVLASSGCESPVPRPGRCVPDVTSYTPLEPMVPGQASGGSALVADLVYDRVLAGSPGPERSAAVVVGEEGGVLQLRLREARFHDGTRVTAADVAASIEAFPLGAGLRATASSAAELEVRDDRTGGALRRLLALVPVAPASSAGALPDWRPPPGSGPFRLVSLGPRLAELAAWEGAAGGSPPLPAVRISAVEGQKVAWARAMRGETDLLLDVPQEVAGFLRQLPSWTVAPAGSRKSYFVAVSARARRLRLAELLDQALRSGELPPIAGMGSGPPPVFCGAPPALQPGALPDPGGPFELLYFESDGASAEVALRLQQRLAELRLDARLSALPLDLLLARYSTGDYDLGVAYTRYAGAGELAPLLEFVRQSGLGSPSAALLAAADAFDETGDPAPIRAAWAAELPLLCWFSQDDLVAVRSPWDASVIATPPVTTLLRWKPPAGCP